MILRLYRTTLLTGAVYWFCFSEQRNIFLCTFNLIFVMHKRSVFGSKDSSFRELYWEVTNIHLLASSHLPVIVCYVCYGYFLKFVETFHFRLKTTLYVNTYDLLDSSQAHLYNFYILIIFIYIIIKLYF